MLAASGVDYTVDGKPILREVDLVLPSGEVLAVIGPNGAGKSSVSRVLSGEVVPDRGEVSMNGRPLHQWSLKQRARMRAVLPQNSSLQFAFRVMDVVLMGRSPHNPSLFTEQDHAIATAAMRRADVYHLHDRLFPSLSGGERQRVHLARVLAQIWESGDKTTRYLLLDEPTSALDLSHQHSTLAIVRRLADEQGTGVLVVLHDLNLAALYADRVAVMQSGRLVCKGAPGEVLRSDIIEGVFGIAVSVDAHPAKPDRPLVITNPFKHRMRGIEHAR